MFATPNTIPKAPRAVGQAVWTLVAVAVLVGAGLAAYSNSFDGVFLFDDMGPILDNERIRTIWPIWDPWAEDAGSRPAVDLSLKINWALAEKEHDNEPAEFGFHVFNLAVHILAGLTLFGIVRRTLRTRPLAERFGRWSDWLALSAAVLWLVHPLQTSSVTYIIQRAESMMGLFYLLTLYCAIRYFGSSHRYLWLAGSVVACLAGVGCKQVIVTVPVMVLLYDWVFVSGGLGKALRRHWPLHAMLVLTWVPLLAMSIDPMFRNHAAGFGTEGVTVSQYAVTQPGVILHYLRLSFWPSELCLDYMWPPVTAAWEIVTPAIVIFVLLGGTVLAMKNRPGLGYLGAWFFLILVPSSSIMPIRDLAFEHRMYLSLAAVVVLVVVGSFAACQALAARRSTGSPAKIAVTVVLCVSAVAAGALGVCTYRRNADYANPTGMWSDVITKRPYNCRAHHNLGVCLDHEGKRREAIAAYRRAIQLNPSYADAHHNLANIFAQLDRRAEAIASYQRAIKAQPDRVASHAKLAELLRQEGRLDEAFGYGLSALEHSEKFKKPEDLAGVFINMGNVRLDQGVYDEAIELYEKALVADADSVLARTNMGVAKDKQGKLDEAMEHFRAALAIDPENAEAHVSLGNALAKSDRPAEAAEQYELALGHKEQIEGQNELAKVYARLGSVLARQGKYAEAAEHFDKALEIQSDLPGAAEALAKVRSMME